MEDIKSLLTQSIQDLWQLTPAVEVTPAPDNARFADGRPVDYACNVAMPLAGLLKKLSAKHQSTTPKTPLKSSQLPTSEKSPATPKNPPVPTTSSRPSTPENPAIPLSPREVAAALRTRFLDLCQNTPLAGTEVEIAGPGFLNFISPDAYFTHKLADLSAKLPQNISPDAYSKISPGEYSQTPAPAPTSPAQDSAPAPAPAPKNPAPQIPSLKTLEASPLLSLYRDQTIICEFSDPNPFKVLHVGHLYTSIVGDAISRLLEAAGARVIRANFGGDVGLHVAKNMYALLRHREEPLILPSTSTSAASALKNQKSTPATPASKSPQFPTSSPAPKSQKSPASPPLTSAILAPSDPTPLPVKAEFMAACYVEGTNAYEDSPSAHAEITQLNHLLYHLVQFALDHNYVHGATPLTEAQIEKLTSEFIPTYAPPIPEPSSTKSPASKSSTPTPSAEAPTPSTESSTASTESPAPPANASPLTPAQITLISRLYWHGRATSYAYFQDFYAKIGLKFDKFYPESTVAGLGLATVLAHTAPEPVETSPAPMKNPASIEDSPSPIENPTPAPAKTPAHVYLQSHGAIIFPGEAYGLHTRVFVNQNGLPTYETKDVGLLFTKFQDYHFDRSIVITGGEQADYMAVVLKSVEQYAPDLVRHTTHLTHGIVKLPGHVKMSSRKGNFLKAVDVLNLVSAELAASHPAPSVSSNASAPFTPDTSAQPAPSTSSTPDVSLESIPNASLEPTPSASSDPIVALGATKFALLKYKLGGNIEFNLKESVSMTGNSGPYLQYSAVRAQKILKKAAASTAAPTSTAPTSTTTSTSTASAPHSSSPNSPEPTTSAPHSSATPPSPEASTPSNPSTPSHPLTPSERALIKSLLLYPPTLADAAATLAPHKLCTYLYALAQDFSRFYELTPVLGSPEQPFRLHLVATYLATLTHGLALLGIAIPEEM